MATQVSEKDFQATVVDIARLYGWLVYHVRDSRTAISQGFPDLTLARKGRVIFAELKTEKGRIRPEQQIWRRAIEGIDGDGPEFYFWRPSDLETISNLLSKRDK